MIFLGSGISLEAGFAWVSRPMNFRTAWYISDNHTVPLLKLPREPFYRERILVFARLNAEKNDLPPSAGPYSSSAGVLDPARIR